MTRTDRWAPPPPAATRSPLPQSTTTGRGPRSSSDASTVARSGASGPAPRGSRERPGAAATSSRARPSAGTSSPAANRAARRGVSGWGMPSTAGASPARSARTAPDGTRRARRRANEAATTLVPTPPLTDQQATSTGRPPRRRSTRGEVRGGPRRRYRRRAGRSGAEGYASGRGVSRHQVFEEKVPYNARKSPKTGAGPDRSPLASAPVSPRAAAFFDLDKTVIAKASMVAFSGPLHRAGLVSRRMLLRAAWGQLVYAQFGASPARLAKMRDSVLRLTRGWDQAEISAIVRETLVEVVEPIVFDEALELIREHQVAGRKVFIVSASPEEIVAPLAQFLGVDEAIATRAELDDEGRYTGRTERYCYGRDKVVAMEEAARGEGIDLAASFAYSDSATDLPMLEAVGHPVAVNPDRDLLRAARARDWEVRRFTRGVPLRERVPMPAPRHAALGGGALAAAVGAGFAARWLWDRRQPAPPASAAPSLLDAGDRWLRRMRPPPVARPT